MKQLLILDKIDQLKAISDPLRISIISHLVQKEHTGQQLAEILDLSRSKIHYHLGELEKNGIVEVVRKEEKKGIVQKFFRTVAYSIIPSDDLLPMMDSSYVKQLALEVISTSKEQILLAPDTSFEFKAANFEQQPLLLSQLQLKLSETAYVRLINKINKIIEEISEEDKDSSDKKTYYSAMIGFAVDKPVFDED